MKFQFSLRELNNILNNNLINFTKLDLTTSIEGVVTDTRQLNSGEIFIALRGKNFDGHNFVTEAIARGAVAAVVSVSYPIWIYRKL